MKIFTNRFTGKVCTLLAILTLFCGCIHEDNDDCPSPVGTVLRFTYTLNTEYTDLFNDQVKAIALFVYNEQGTHILTKDISTVELEEGNRFFLELLPDKYHLIVWGNLDKNFYDWRDPMYYNNFYMDLLSGENGEVKTKPSSLFYGSAHVELMEDQTKECTIELIKDVNDVHVIMENGEGDKVNHYALITGNNGSYDINNNRIVNTTQIKYQARYQTLENATQADFTVMRLFINDNMTISLGWDGQTGDIIQLPLVEEIMKHPEINTNEDLDRWDDFTLTYKRQADGTVVLIRINDWDVIENPGGI